MARPDIARWKRGKWVSNLLGAHDGVPTPVNAALARAAAAEADDLPSG